MGSHINTCGNWCVNRALNYKLSNDQYTRYVLSSYKSSLNNHVPLKNLDEWVMLVT